MDKRYTGRQVKTPSRTDMAKKEGMPKRGTEAPITFSKKSL